MRLTLHTDYALRVLIYLSVDPDARATVQEVAAAYAISRHHLVKVVHRLGTLGYIRTVRGKGGGFTLARAPCAIRIGALVRDLEDDLALVECFRPPPGNACRITSACLAAGALREALGAFFDVLDRYTLAMVASDAGELAAALSGPVVVPVEVRGGTRPR